MTKRQKNRKKDIFLGDFNNTDGCLSKKKASTLMLLRESVPEREERDPPRERLQPHWEQCETGNYNKLLSSCNCPPLHRCIWLNLKSKAAPRWNLGVVSLIFCPGWKKLSFFSLFFLYIIKRCIFPPTSAVRSGGGDQRVLGSRWKKS